MFIIFGNKVLLLQGHHNLSNPHDTSQFQCQPVIQILNDHSQILSSYSELIDYPQIFSLQCPVHSIQIQTHTRPGDLQTCPGPTRQVLVNLNTLSLGIIRHFPLLSLTIIFPMFLIAFKVLSDPGVLACAQDPKNPDSNILL